ncbi:hypothetical protein D3C85_1605810 [compost metagenome]
MDQEDVDRRIDVGIKCMHLTGEIFSTLFVGQTGECHWIKADITVIQRSDYNITMCVSEEAGSLSTLNSNFLDSICEGIHFMTPLFGVGPE